MVKKQFTIIEEALDYFSSNPLAAKETLGLDKEESLNFDKLVDNVTDENTDSLAEYLFEAAELALEQ